MARTISSLTRARILLESKLTRQKLAVETTEDQIEMFEEQLEILRTTPPPKTPASIKSGK